MAAFDLRRTVWNSFRERAHLLSFHHDRSNQSYSITQRTGSNFVHLERADFLSACFLSSILRCKCFKALFDWLIHKTLSSHWSTKRCNIKWILCSYSLFLWIYISAQLLILLFPLSPLLRVPSAILFSFSFLSFANILFGKSCVSYTRSGRSALYLLIIVIRLHGETDFSLFVLFVLIPVLLHCKQGKIRHYWEGRTLPPDKKWVIWFSTWHMRLIKREEREKKKVNKI